MSWDWGVYTTLSAKWNEKNRSQIEINSEDWAEMLYKASHEMRRLERKKQQISIPNWRMEFKMHVYSFLFSFLHTKPIFHHPFLHHEKFGVYMIYEFKMKREQN